MLGRGSLKCFQDLPCSSLSVGQTSSDHWVLTPLLSLLGVRAKADPNRKVNVQCHLSVLCYELLATGLL